MEEEEEECGLIRLIETHEFLAISTNKINTTD